ncbi:MAG: hypothetical protein ACQSGP_29270 [Frankia sp.]
MPGSTFLTHCPHCASQCGMSLAPDDDALDLVAAGIRQTYPDPAA